MDTNKRRARKLSESVGTFRPRVPINVTISAENADYLNALAAQGKIASRIVDEALTVAREMEDEEGATLEKA